MKELDPAKIRRLSFALLGLVSTHLSFVVIGMPKEKIEASTSLLRKVFVESCSVFLEQEAVAVPAGASGAEKTA
jgi:hypothetical protein